MLWKRAGTNAAVIQIRVSVTTILRHMSLSHAAVPDSVEAGASVAYRLSYQRRAVAETLSQQAAPGSHEQDLASTPILSHSPTDIPLPSAEGSEAAVATAMAPAFPLTFPELCASPNQDGRPEGSAALGSSESEERTPSRACQYWTSDGTGGAAGADCILDWSSDDDFRDNQRRLPGARLSEHLLRSNIFTSNEPLPLILDTILLQFLRGELACNCTDSMVKVIVPLRLQLQLCPAKAVSTEHRNWLTAPFVYYSCQLI